MDKKSKNIYPIKNINLTAKQARIAANQVCFDVAFEEIQNIMHNIKEKVNKGEYSLYIDSISKPTAHYLLSAGYKINGYSDDDFDIQNPGCIICW